MEIRRERHLEELERLLRQFPVVAILGARQIGKTTLARQLSSRRSGTVTFFDLERTEDRAALQNPQLTLQRLRGLVVLDEIQRQPDLFEALRVLADRPRKLARFVVLGSASPELLSQSESLAGRIAYYSLGGLDLGEIEPARATRLWLRGGFPRSFLARSHERTAPDGGASSSPRSSSETCRSSGSRSGRRHSDASGPCSLTTTAASGTHPRLPARSAWPTPRSVATSIS